ncbi:Glucosamine-phosphate N-acetyltransferase-like protein [Nowakowskiella sp. JEL0407]|nr:Glucosamine-phosphate N-acetyltransferase-like protein [Nowakowskiella sp. JEL0407]
MALFDKLYISGDVQNALPAGFVVRPLEIGDYEKGFLEALEMLTSVGKMSKGQFIERFSYLKAHNHEYFTIVIEDTKKAKIVGAGTIFVERKFVHLNGLVGHIEDIVTHKDYRGMNLGKL